MGVRWDAVVAGSRFWAEPRRPTAAVSAAGTDASVEVWLFGTLADAIPERPVTLQLRIPFCVADVIAELGRRCGGEFLARVTNPDGRKLSHCRVFVNGEPTDDTAAPVRAETSTARIEMILLTAAEGG